MRVEAGYTQLFPGRYRTERDAESLLLLLLVFGLLTLANAVWMLAGPMHWYTKLAAGVPDTGPFNPHFVRDIGDAFLTTGIALLWAYRSPHFRLPLVGVAATFLACHAMPCPAPPLRHRTRRTGARPLPGIALPLVALRLARSTQEEN